MDKDINNINLLKDEIYNIEKTLNSYCELEQNRLKLDKEQLEFEKEKEKNNLKKNKRSFIIELLITIFIGLILTIFFYGYINCPPIATQNNNSNYNGTTQTITNNNNK